MHVIDRITETGTTVTQLEGREVGTDVSIIFESTDVPGAGPDLHQHPYPETFVIHAGRALFTVRDEQLVGSAGQVIVVPELTPHKFEVLGPERYESTHIHQNDTFITEWLEGPRAT